MKHPIICRNVPLFMGILNTVCGWVDNSSSDSTIPKSPINQIASKVMLTRMIRLIFRKKQNLIQTLFPLVLLQIKKLNFRIAQRPLSFDSSIGANLTTMEDVQNSFNATQPSLCGRLSNVEGYIMPIIFPSIIFCGWVVFWSWNIRTLSIRPPLWILLSMLMSNFGELL